MADAIDYAWYNGADILSCSWARLNAMVDVLTVAVVRAATLGRGGKGSALFFSAGNDGVRYGEYHIVWPQMMDQVMTIGATDTNDCIRDYSNYGKIDVVAPSGAGYKISYDEGIWTTDLPDNMGYVFAGGSYACGDPLDLDYMCVFSGTSASQPVAAGVGALLLSVRPELTRLELYNIIRNSADPNLAITITQPPDEKYGYGMVHPMRALLSVCRGDANNDDNIDLLDVLYIGTYLYESGPEPTPHPLMGDAKGDGNVNLLDVLYLIAYLYDNPPGPPPPISFNYGEYEF